MPISTQFHRLRVPLSITALLAALTLPAFAQYTDNAAMQSQPNEFSLLGCYHQPSE